MERIATLTELRQYLDAGLTLKEVVARVEDKHGLVKIFDHSPEAMRGLRFRYFVMPLDAKGKPQTKLAPNQQLQ